MENNIKPDYYGGSANPYEAIKIIEAHNLNFASGSVVKYVLRAGKKDPTKHIEDLQKAQQYLTFEIGRVQKERDNEWKDFKNKKPIVAVEYEPSYYFITTGHTLPGDEILENNEWEVINNHFVITLNDNIIIRRRVPQ